MTGFIKKAAVGAVMASTVLTVAAPADAQRYWRHRDRGGDTAAAAIIGGVLGLGVGAAIASSNNDRYYDRGYYNDRGYYPEYRAYPRPYYRNYYRPPPPPPRAYYRGYYGGDYYGGRGGYYGDAYGW